MEQNTKHGDIKKCPACGAFVSLVQAKCPECGYEFSNVDANTTSTKLLKALEDIDVQCARLRDGDSLSVTRKIQTIKNFPIPNTKDDLIEMLTLCQANSKDTGSEPELAKAWANKTEQVIAKAQIALKDDQDAIFLINQIKGNQASKKKKQLVLIIAIASCVIIAIAGVLIYKNAVDNKNLENTSTLVAYQSKITSAIQQDDVVAAYNLLDSLNSEIAILEMNDEFEELAGGSYLKIVMALLQQGELQDAARVGLEYRDKLNNPNAWHNSQIYKLLIQECDAQDIDTSVLE